VRQAKHGAQIKRPQVSAMSAEEDDVITSFAQPLPTLADAVRLYERPTVTIIDDRAVSQAEHTGLFFEAANATTFVGTPTAGRMGMSRASSFRVAFRSRSQHHASLFPNDPRRRDTWRCGR
jgi:hypothetical protein